MIWSVSWKNVWRNKIRSLVLIAAFIIGIIGGVYSVAVFVGMVDQRVKVAIGNEASHIQIHDSLFLENNELKYTINNYSDIVHSIGQIPEVSAVSPRIKIMAMASTAGNASGVIISGIIPEKEKQVTGIAGSIVSGGGSYFNNDDRKPIVIGEKLAKNLKLVYYQITAGDLENMSHNKRLKGIVNDLDTIINVRFRTEKDFEKSLETILVKQKAPRLSYWIKREAIKYKIGQKIVLSFQALDGHLAYDAFRVVGIYKTTNTSFDGLNVFVPLEDIAPVATIPPDEINEIAIMLTSTKYGERISEKIQSMYPELFVQKWDEIMPEAGMYSKTMNFYLMIFMVIILLALGFGIVNTMLMAVLERVKELGMLMAVGMNKKRVFSMIMLETVFLSLVGTFIGMVITYSLILYSGKTGLDFSALYGEGLEIMGFGAVVYPKLGWSSFIQVTIMVIITGVLASIYPARKALKLKPSEALRIDM